MVFGVLLALGWASAAAAKAGHAGPSDMNLRSYYHTAIGAAMGDDQGDQNDQGDQGDEGDQGSGSSGDEGGQGDSQN